MRDRTERLTPIQFVGTQRSGSNLLRVMLNQLEAISAPHPPHILKTFFPLLPLYGNLDEKQNFERLVSDVCEWVRVNPVPWDTELKPGNIIKQCKRNTLIELFTRIYEQKALHDHAKLWCCKSMESVNYYRELEASGIAPFYIHIFRDGRDVALSFMKAPVGPKHVYFLAEKWKQEQELSLQLRALVGAQRFIPVRYEELLHDPAGVIRFICLKLGIDYDDSALDYFHSTESINTANSGKMWSNVTKPVMENNHDKFAREFSEEQLMLFERVAGDMLEQLGYKTIYWPNVPSDPFTPAELEAFRREDESLRKRVLAETDPEDIRRRKPQEELLRKIKRKNTALT